MLTTNIATTTTYFVGAYYEVTGSTITKYYFAGSQRIAMRTNGTLNFLLGDHLGSTSLVTDANGVVISETRYKAWGEVRYSSGTLPTKYTYTGQYTYANDFGLMYYGARWYDSSLGRFTQADSIIPNGVQGMDRYAYVNNSPMKYIDPSGHMIPCEEGDICGHGSGSNGNGNNNSNGCSISSGSFNGSSCTPDQINAATLQQRYDWFSSLVTQAHASNWFVNILSILRAFMNSGIGAPGSWISWGDAGILSSVADGWIHYKNGTNTSSSAGSAWKAFFVLFAKPSANQGTLGSLWGAAENLGTQYGSALATAHGVFMNESERRFVNAGNRFYRDLLASHQVESFYGQWGADIASIYCDVIPQGACNRLTQWMTKEVSKVGVWFTDPTSTIPIPNFEVSPVYYFARYYLDWTKNW